MLVYGKAVEIFEISPPRLGKCYIKIWQALKSLRLYSIVV